MDDIQGAVMWSAWVTGERSRNLSASVSGAPRTVVTKVFQVDGAAWARVNRVAGPQMGTPAAQG